MEEFKVYWNYKRIVNQNEIVEFLRLNPCKTEGEIMFELYDFVRGGVYSNKKYADCLRRALHSKKIWRARIKCKKGDNRKLYRYFVKE